MPLPDWKQAMKLTDNTILITGGGSGIGLGLARTFHEHGNRVVIAGRRESLLREAIATFPGMSYVLLDQASTASIEACAETVCHRFPALNVLINNAGVQHVEDLTKGDVSTIEETLRINLLGPMHLTATLLSQLRNQESGAILNVTSTLGMMPAAGMPSYCASKAAMHSYTQSLRFQLRETGVQVIEIIPPWVQTALQGPGRGMNPKAMPLGDYIAEVWALLRDHPEDNEIVVERAKAMRFAERGDFDAFYKRYNEGWLASQAK